MKRRWRKRPRKAEEFAVDFEAALGRIADQFVSEDGRCVDYAGLAKSTEFKAYVNCCLELQTLDLRDMPQDKLKVEFLFPARNTSRNT